MSISPYSTNAHPTHVAAGPVLPDRPIYRIANGYSEIYPYANALGRALGTSGTRVDKFNAGSDDLAYWLAFKAFSKIYSKAINKLYETHPGLAEQVNKHPILFGVPVGVVGMTFAAFGAEGGKKLWQIVRQTYLEKQIEGAVNGKLGDGVAHVLRPAAKFLARPAVKMSAAIVTGLLMGTYLVRLFQDTWSFGREYRQARKLDAFSTPYALKSQVALNRSFPTQALGA